MWNGNDESPDEDTATLLQIFPQEVWFLMLNQVKAPAVLENVYNSSLFFNRLLRKRRVEFLLPRVWNPFVFSLRPCKVGDNEFPKEVIKLRLVSQGWKNVIDNFIQSQAMQEHLVGVTPDPEKLMNVSGVAESFRFQVVNNNFYVPKFLKHFKSTHGRSDPPKNPFIANKILLEIPYRHEYPFKGFRDEYVRDMTKLLDQYGHFLHICHFRVYDLHERSESYNEIRNWLLQMPNLKCLYIDFIEIIPDPREAARLKKNVMMDPVSKLTHLEHLITQNVAPAFFNILVSVQNHVTTLQVHTGADRPNYDLHTPSFSNLKHFSISYEEPQNLIDKLRTVQIDCSVKILKLRVAAPTASLIELFQLLAFQFGGTLTHFKLTLLLPRKLIGFKNDEDRSIWNEVMSDELAHLKNSYLPDTTQFQLDFEEKPDFRLKYRSSGTFFKKF